VRGSRRIGALLVGAVALVAPGPAAAVQAPESAFLYMGSQRGEFIGAGAEWRYTHANGTFAADYGRPNAPDPSSIRINIDQTADGHGPWDVELGAPRGRTLTAGRYLDAQDIHVRPPGLPGMRLAGDGRACGRIDGRFVVREARFTAAGDVIRFRASFVQYCDGYLTALYGVVGIGVPPPASFPKPPATVPASISLRSDPGDFVGQGQAARYSNLENALFQVLPGTSGSIFVRSFGYEGSVWSVDLAAPGQRLPRPGVYEGAMRHPFEPPGAPGLAVAGNGRGCNMLSGRFVVDDARYGPRALVRSLRARFEQHCEGAAPALRGEVRVAFPQPAVRAALRVIPAPPLAGRRFAARLVVRDPGIRVRGVRCAAMVEGRRLARIKRAATRRRAVCAWRLPLSARGKKLRGFVRVRARGAVVTRRFRLRVR
jgi:hypothetical protein